MTQARLIGENEESIPGNGRLDQSFLQQQAASSSKEQFANSAELQSELTNSIINALDAHPAMGSKALNNPAMQLDLRAPRKIWVLRGPTSETHCSNWSG